MFSLFCLVVLGCVALCTGGAIVMFESGEVVAGYMLSVGAVVIFGIFARYFLPYSVFAGKWRKG